MHGRAPIVTTLCRLKVLSMRLFVCLILHPSDISRRHSLVHQQQLSCADYLHLGRYSHDTIRTLGPFNRFPPARGVHRANVMRKEQIAEVRYKC